MSLCNSCVQLSEMITITSPFLFQRQHSHSYVTKENLLRSGIQRHRFHPLNSPCLSATGLRSSQDTAGISLPVVITHSRQTLLSHFVLCALMGDILCTVSSAENWLLQETLMHAIGACFSGVFLPPFKDRDNQISPPLIEEMLKD